MITSEKLSKKKGVYEASLLVDSVDGMFDSVSFGMVTRNGEALDLYMTLTPYGLVHTYDGAYKEDVDEVVSLLSDKLAKKVGLTFEERVDPEITEPLHEEPAEAETPTEEASETAEPTEENTEEDGEAVEESVSTDEVGSAEDILGDIVEPQNEEQ